MEGRSLFKDVYPSFPSEASNPSKSESYELLNRICSMNRFANQSRGFGSTDCYSRFLLKFLFSSFDLSVEVDKPRAEEKYEYVQNMNTFSPTSTTKEEETCCSNEREKEREEHIIPSCEWRRLTNAEQDIISFFSAMSRRSSIVTRSARNTANADASESPSPRSRTLSGGVANRSPSTSSAARQLRSSSRIAPVSMAERTLSENSQLQQQRLQQALPTSSAAPTVSAADDDMEITDDEDGSTPAQSQKSTTNLLPVRHLFREDVPGIFTCLVQVQGKPCERVRHCPFSCSWGSDEKPLDIPNRHQLITDV